MVFEKKDNARQIAESLAESEFSIIYPEGEPRESVAGADVYDRKVDVIPSTSDSQENKRTKMDSKDGSGCNSANADSARNKIGI